MRNRVVGSLLIAAVSLGTSAPTRAASPTVARFSFNGSQVSTNFSGNGPTTCADGSPGFVAAGGFLQGAQQIISQTGQPTINSNGVFISLDFFFNSCTGVFLGGFGQVVNGLTPPDKKLTSATMAGTGLVQDFSTGATVPVSMNVTLTGTGNLSTQKSNTKSRLIGTTGGPVLMRSSHQQFQIRLADAAGTMSFDGVAIDPFFSGAQLIANDNSELTIDKQ